MSIIEEALAIAESLDDAPRLASVLLRRANVSTYLGDHAKARSAAERALETYRTLGDRPGEAEALRDLGFAHWHAGEHAPALERSREALELHRRLGDVAGEASALHNLAEIHRSLGSPRRAIELYEQALRLHWGAQNRDGEILSLLGLGRALQQAHDLPGSRAIYETALKLSDAQGERTMQSRTLHALSAQYAAQGQIDVALGLMRRAVEVDRAIGYGHALGHDLIDLATLYLRRAERARARVSLQEALMWFGFTEDRDAMESTRALLRELDSGGDLSASLTNPRSGVKSHLPLGEGKVYCEFESPLARGASV